MDGGKYGKSIDSGSGPPPPATNPMDIPGVSEKYWKLTADSTSVAILAKETLIPPKKPGLDRQPKTLNALGKGGLLKHKEREKSIQKQRSLLPSGSSIADVQASGSFRRMTNRSIKSRSSLPIHKRGSVLSSMDISGSEGGGSKGTDDEDRWALFAAGEEGLDGDDGDLEEQEPKFEMAVVEIDVNEAQAEMDKVLKKMLRQARTTEREKTVLADTFGMFLQALVHMQEGEVEAIDHLQTKNGILQTMTYFLRSRDELDNKMVEKSEEKVEDEDGIGLLEAMAAPVVDEAKEEIIEEDDSSVKKTGDKPPKSAHGVSVDEMNVATLRETYLGQKNRIDMQTHLRHLHSMELKQVQFEKTLMDLHYSKMVKPSDLLKEMKDIRKIVTDLELELTVIRQGMADLRSDIAAEEKALHEDELSTDRLDLEMLTKQMEVQQNSNKPLHMAKEADKEARRLEQLFDTLTTLNDRWSNGMETIRRIQDKIDVYDLEYQNLAATEGKMFSVRKNSLSSADTLSADMEVMLKKEQNLLDKCAAATESLVLAGRTRKRLQDALHHAHNLSNKALRDCQKLERQTATSREALTNTKLAYEKMRSAFESMRPKDDANNWEKLSKMFQREIYNLKMALTNRIEDASYTAHKVEQLQIELNVLYDDQIDAGRDLQEMIRTTVRKRRERQEKSEQCIKLEAQVNRLAADKKIQQLMLDDCGRSERDLRKMMRALRKKYMQLKIERASYMNDLILARQKLTEQREKIKICTNESDSINNAILERTRDISQAHFLNLNAGLARDSFQNEALRSIVTYRLRRKERDEIQLCNNTLRKEIQAQEREVVLIREKFEALIHESNAIATGLRDRTEEVCTVMEKSQVFEGVIHRGKLELMVRELEKSKLEAIHDEVKKHLLIVAANQPDESKVIAQIATLRAKLTQINQERIEMEATVNNVRDESRRRDVRHDLLTKRETPELLDARLSNLEKSLATRDFLRLERNLILKQVVDVTEDALTKANFLKEHYAKEVKILVGIRKELYHLSNRIDGMICEASLAHAKAQSTEARYDKLKKQVDEAEVRFENGFSPSDEMEQEFQRILWREEMIRRSNNRPKGFFRQPKVASGSKIIMERMRPKPRAMTAIPPSRAQEAVAPQFPFTCKRRQFRPIRFRSATATKADLRQNETGLPICNVAAF